MYKYFSELEKAEEHNIYLKISDYDKYKGKNKHVMNSCLPENFVLEHRDIFERMNTIDTLVEGSNEQLLLMDSKNLSYEKWENMNCFFQKKEEEYYYTKKLKEKINIDATELEELLRDYIIYCNFLTEIYPEIESYILKTIKVLEKTLLDLKNKTTIKIEKQEETVTYTFPNAWYITPNGYLYNTGTGHKEGNLIYPFYNRIYPFLCDDKDVPNVNLFPEIKAVLDRKYITSLEFSNYTNLIYEIPTILTPEIQCDMERYEILKKMGDKQIKKILENKESLPHLERSYQKNIVTLIVGYLSAKQSLFQSFSKLNSSSRKKEIMNTFSKMNLDDILVRFSGFHKISSVADKTITTSSITSIELFEEYLNKGWTLDIIPGILYDKEKDELLEMNFSWYHIEKYLDRVLNEKNRSGKILIKK